MEAVLGLFLILLRVSHGMENFCDGRQNGAQFYGPLGGTLVLQLMDKVNDKGTVLLKNSTKTLLEIKQGSIRYYTENKFFFTPDNGTLRINNLSRTDSGEHKVSLYYEGRLIKTQTVNIHVQAPVSSVSFSTVCLFLGEMKVSCSSQRGDDPQYSWTLNGSPLTENELLSGNHLNKTITLKQHVHGLLKCSVSNYISHSSYTDQISTCGMENFCDGRQNETQCYGPLGGTLVLQLMDKVNVKGTVLLKNSTQTLLEIKQGSIRYYIENKFFFTPDNGTLRINNLSRTDSGEYKVSLYYDGRLNRTQTVNIHVQAPVSSVNFSTVCLFLGEMKVSCSSQRGDDPQYSWTLNGSPLTENELLSGNHLNKTITLKQHVHGLLKCSVSNYISHSSYTDQISTCGFIFINCTLNETHISKWVFKANNTLCIHPTTIPTTVPTAAHWQVMVGVLVVLILLLLVAVSVCLMTQQKKGNNGRGVTDGVDQELTYANVNKVQRRQEKTAAEDTVEYGQIFFKEKPRQTANPVQDECIYSSVVTKPRQQLR
ncbi:uncharacterized protein LOC103391003 isoform X2 [Cynoglossus semilaevis]|uniref:uncharacterized protein LOC103391003 isoform X2 n=1 Tax=Cynoglossus semilaevis TaxID=244447 RepID=UPI000D62C1AA|nr:uncharacterized protein LOC103391003 isoform X2 [Cynoglossus semilaevis]